MTYDLATGAGTEVDGVEPTDPLVSPDGAWRIDESTPLREVLVPESGDEVVPDTGTDRWGLVSACAESLRTGSAATDAVATLLRSSATDYERTDERVQSGFRGLLPG